MFSPNKITLTIASLLIAFGLTACKGTVQPLVLGLEALVDSASVASSLLSVMNPGPTTTAISTYVNAVAQAATQAIPEIESTDTWEQKTTKVTAIFAAVATPQVGQLSGQILAAVNAIVNAAQLFLSQLKYAQVQLGNAPQGVVKIEPLTMADKAKLHDIDNKAKAITAKLSAHS